MLGRKYIKGETCARFWFAVFIAISIAIGLYGESVFLGILSFVVIIILWIIVSTLIDGSKMKSENHLLKYAETMTNTNYIAIDFENADNDQLACAFGAAVIENGKIVETHKFLIRPPENRYGRHQMRVHGMNPKMTEESDEFPLFYDRIRELIHGKNVIAHNYSTEKSVLNKTCQHYNLPLIEPLQWFCTYNLFDEKLEVLCRNYDINLSHHDPESDAIAAAKLFLIYNSITPAQPIIETVPTVHGYELVRKEDFVNDIATDIEIDFKNKKFVVSGTFNNIERDKLIDLLVAQGGAKQSSVTAKTNYLVAGDNIGPSKLERAKELSVPILTEQMVLGYLERMSE